MPTKYPPHPHSASTVVRAYGASRPTRRSVPSPAVLARRRTHLRAASQCAVARSCTCSVAAPRWLSGQRSCAPGGRSCSPRAPARARVRPPAAAILFLLLLLLLCELGAGEVVWCRASAIDAGELCRAGEGCRVLDFPRVASQCFSVFRWF
jgi:hypothetical protein